MRQLPPGWARGTLEECAEVVRGVTFSTSVKRMAPAPGLVRCLRTSNVQEVLETEDVLYIPKHCVKRQSQWLSVGDVLISMANSFELVGKVAFTNRVDEPTTFGAFIAAIRARRIEPKFLMHQLRSTAVRTAMRRGASQTVNIANISLAVLNPMPILVPPKKEQLRIAEALDSYLSRLDAAEKSLEQAQAKLKAYRASVLKAAVEGRLVPTEAELARQENRSYEPAQVLLERILKERRRRWEEAELARLKKAGKTPKNDKWKAKYEEPVAPDTTKLPELPEGWCWASLDALAEVKGGVTKGPKRQGKDYLEVPYLRVANVQRGFLDLRELKSIFATPEEIDELRLRRGDVLFNEGGDRDKLGRGWVWEDQAPICIHQNHVFRARIWTQDFHPRLLSWYGNSSGQRYFFDQGKQTTNLASVNSSKLKALPVPVPPGAEQLRVVDEIERVLSICEADSSLLELSQGRIARLRQSILKWAFEGRLVDQDPNDESADDLLARVRAERSAAPKRSLGRRRKASSRPAG